MTTLIARQLYDDQGLPHQLGTLVGRGGEGSVYELDRDGSRVGKVYHDPSRINVEKLQAMVRVSNSELAKISAWPEKTLHLQRGGRVVGFVMPRADGVVLEELLGPGSRKLVFPQATYPLVVRAALNLAKAFATTHRSGAVVGDVKEINALVNNQAIVTLIDTDGFQIRDPQTGRLFLTAAVTFTHQPPELQDVSDPSRIVRTPDQDAFGLGTLIFQLLFMGRHPFIGGVPIARVDLQPADMIKRLQFSYVPNLSNRLYAPPPGTLGLDAVGPLGPLFIRAFLGQPNARPTSSDWAAALTDYEKKLQRCSANHAHAHYGAGECPLCRIESQNGTLLFLGAIATATRGGVQFDLAAIWMQITSVPSPEAAPQLPAAPTRTPIAAAVAVGRVRRRQKLVALVIAIAGGVATWIAIRAVGSGAWWLVLIGLVVAWIVWAQGTEDAAVYKKALAGAQNTLKQLTARWSTEAGDRAFQERLRQLQQSRTELAKLEDERKQKLAGLQSTIRQRQLDRHLQSKRIGHARISQIGPSSVTTLRSYGIETAFDLTDANLSRYIPGIGATRRANLAAWRDEVKGSFRFDGSKGIDPQDLAGLHQDINRRRMQHEQLLRLGPIALKQLSEQALRRRAELLPIVQTALAEGAQARANAKAAG